MSGVTSSRRSQRSTPAPGREIEIEVGVVDAVQAPQMDRTIYPSMAALRPTNCPFSRSPAPV
ncbi:MAG: hypothetical protein A3H97_17490 [Acidobacteria bacterium RIFCSPLOWO2_02_FULL_65_29]|nr:MAG: hypothetical protein A3H97_17490 [Acidobacteria bacterium RIFCSPLOWO2_02_FULL_65_29]